MYQPYVDDSVFENIPQIGMATLTTGIVTRASRTNNAIVKGHFFHNGVSLTVGIFEPDGERWFEYLYPGDQILVRNLTRNTGQYNNELKATAVAIINQPPELQVLVSTVKSPMSMRQQHRTMPEPEAEPQPELAPEPVSAASYESPSNPFTPASSATELTLDYSGYSEKVSNPTPANNKRFKVSVTLPQHLYNSLLRIQYPDEKMPELIRRAVDGFLKYENAVALHQTRA